MFKSEIEDIVKNVIEQMAKIKSFEVLLSSKLEGLLMYVFCKLAAVFVNLAFLLLIGISNILVHSL